ncbi:MAG: SDR family NAD(P)-dependent oxidoreductase [Deltaproteobacteria bacterium]|nr:SDR family NAD(P)-dependent oxidoreductase [Deltaproteobacteria bacterium]NND28483.1 SDR family NAD(P)-dependent oxidoreductase [Myxococcales bacterium]MBT8466081.1 SDR family NAD(P)-dependent oxidoreductase [Deltaproteobacteria bacterium]MBT8481534.1 SDR family NAD(P)-dependent oxidoreductase [Deltaproteobacteria bacterium]NNK06186.1 SDR family NAD(P)-dependent oxidoreductase [Myxococcales bacterium]
MSGLEDGALRERVSGRAVLITGASSGIGEALAKRLAAAGATVLLVARSAEKLNQLREEIEARGDTAFAYPADLSNAEETQRLIAAVTEERGNVDILVNNAGISIRRSVQKSYDRVHDFERTLALNFLGAVRLIMGFLPAMRAQKHGQILNVSTIGVQVNVPRYGAYIASKAALDAFSRVLAVEALRDGVKVTTIYMPLVKTPMMASTTIYDAFPMRTAEQAADLIVDGIVQQPKRVATTVGNLFEFAYGVAPNTIDRVLNAAYQLYPESGDRKDLREPISKDAAMFQRVFKLVTRRAKRRAAGRK